MLKKTYGIILTFVILFMSIPCFTETVKAETTSEMANLILFISFSDTDKNYWNRINSVTGSNTVGSDINEIYNETGPNLPVSVKDYFDIASCGKLKLNNIMPQMSKTDYTIVPITLDLSVSNYSSANQDYNMIRNTLEKLNQSPDILGNITERLDCNGDGLIDNVTFIVASGEVGRDSTLYPHKGELGGIGSIQGVPMNAYNVINYGRLETGRAGVVSHELLHVLGPLDTYVNCDDASGNCDAAPVGCWDIMATASHRVQYPLASTRQDLGWITIDEAVTSGTYTLTTPQTDSNHYALILKTAYSDTEYFVVEYRKKGNAYGADILDRMDVNIGVPGGDGSGIIVYRVNLAASPQSNLTQDYIYLFRKGESEQTATATKAREAFLSAESGRTSIGSSDVAASTIDGAITYSDGTNSGIVIKNVGSATGNRITFDLEYTINMTGKSWDSESHRTISVSNEGEMDAAILNGQIYRSNTKIVRYNGKLYGLYSNKDFKAELLCYENGRWRSVWVQPQKTANAMDLDLEAGSDGLYLVYGLSDYTSFKVYRMNASENMTDITGTMAIQGKTANPKITVTSAGLVVAYRDYQDNDKIHAYVKQGNSWQVLDTKGASGNIFQISGSGNDVYLVMANGNGNYLYKCDLANTRTFVKIGNAYATNIVTSVDVVIDRTGNPYVICYDAGRNIVLVQTYQNNAWKQLGMNVCNHMVIQVKAFIENDKMYVAYQGETISGVKSHSLWSTGGTTANTNTEAFVVRLYETCLGRQSDAGGLAYWNQILIKKEKSGAQVGYEFVFSEEYKNRNTSNDDFVEMLYQVFMNRGSDAEGKAYWVDYLNQGLSREYVFQGFAQSQEYTDVCNSYGIERGTVTLSQPRDLNPNLTKFINRIYEKAMGRNGEDDGLNYWCHAVQTGEKSPIQVAEFFITSEEFRNKNLSNEAYIKVLYRTFMGREYDQPGLNYWLGELNRGCSREDILHRFANCQEFRDIMAQFGL